MPKNKKTILRIIFAAIVLCAALALFFLLKPETTPDGSQNAQSDKDVSAAEYEIWYCETVDLRSSVFDDRPMIALSTQTGEFRLDLGVLSGKKFAGKYVQDEAALTLTDAQSGETFVFLRSTIALVFDEWASTGSTDGVLTDGAIFVQWLYRDELHARYDCASFDIDGDGETEIVTIGTGPTSGQFSFTVTATDVRGEKKYIEEFGYEYMNDLDLS